MPLAAGGLNASGVQANVARFSVIALVHRGGGSVPTAAAISRCATVASTSCGISRCGPEAEITAASRPRAPERASRSKTHCTWPPARPSIGKGNRTELPYCR